MFKGFWQNLDRPIVGLSPMDGVTDAAYRYITAKYGKPSVMFTEFVSVEGLSRGITRLLSDLKYSESERPVVAQVFGSHPGDFYTTASIICALGFDGIDINMGCPDRSVSLKQGAGAGLIRNPALAKQIVEATRSGVADYSSGKPLKDFGVTETFLEYIESFRRERNLPSERRILPISIKTRLGFDEIVIEDWISSLLGVEPAVISIHGRTLKQMYTGEANWEEIGKAAKIIKKTETMVLGNGDIKNLQEAYEKTSKYGLDGVLIGRASFGNPWVFKEDYVPTVVEKLTIMLEHVKYFTQNLPGKPFVNIRKSLSWYCRGFEGASTLRSSLMEMKDYKGVEEIVQKFLKDL